MKKIFKNNILKNTILVLLMLFSVNNIGLARNKYFSDGTPINKCILKGTIELVTNIAESAHIENEQEKINDIKFRLELIKIRKDRRYVERACKIVENKNRESLEQIGNNIETDYDQQLINLLKYEAESGIRVDHDEKVIDAIKRFNSLK